MLRARKLFDLSRRLTSTSNVLGAHWNKDWVPGPLPKTEAEMEAAAKKYGLFKEEYQPRPDNGEGSGDYPNFKPYSVESRDQFYPWDCPEYRRNFNEAIEENFHLYTETREDCNLRLQTPMWKMFAMFLTTMGTLYTASVFGEDMYFWSVLPQDMPGDGRKHYKY